MSNVTVRRAFEFPGFGLSRWSTPDYSRPLVLRTSTATALIYAHEEKHLVDGHIVVFPEGHIELQYRPAPESILTGLRCTGAAAQAAARDIYTSYLQAHEKLEALLMSAARVRHLESGSPMSFDTFFQARFGVLSALGRAPVEWSIDGGPFVPFQLKIRKRRGRRPVYRSRELVTPAVWLRMQKAADKGSVPVAERLELFRIRTKAAHRQLKIAAIEASIVSESLLRAYGLQLLRRRGLSRTKIKNLRDELTFNNLLNVVLRMSLRNSELRRIGPAIQAVDALRAARNDLVHGNKTEKQIDAVVVERGVDGALRLARLLSSKLGGDDDA